MPPDSSSETRFERLKARLADIWGAIREDDAYAHTSVIVPSLSVDQEELAKVQGASFYEERLLFALIRLRNPNARLIYVTSQPVHPDVVDYYLQLLPGVPASHARRRLHMLSLLDATPRPLTEKLLERPLALARLRTWIGDARRAYLTCYNATALERRLALELDIPLNGVDPALLELGTKSGSRRVFAEAGVSHPAGSENLRSEDDAVEALRALAAERPGIRRAVVKLNQGFSGEGNGIFAFPEGDATAAAVRARLADLAFPSPLERPDSFFRKFAAMGGVVEEMIEADELHSPSVQMRINPDGGGALVSTHEQVLGGATGQVYLGCRFPAREAYRGLIQAQAERICEVLARHGVVGRFGIDFLLTREAGGEWRSHALEINLRMGGTTPPYQALEFLTGGGLERNTGLFVTPDGRHRYYTASDNLKSPAYRGLLPEDLLDLVTRYRLQYDHATGSGVLFYMIGALSQYGKLGLTCIADSPGAADALLERTVAVLDAAGGGEEKTSAELAPLFDNRAGME